MSKELADPPSAIAKAIDDRDEIRVLKDALERCDMREGLISTLDPHTYLVRIVKSLNDDVRSIAKARLAKIDRYGK